MFRGAGWLVEKLTDLYRPWYHDGLPEDMAFGDIVGRRFVCGMMERTARMAVAVDVAFGVFGVIGIEYASRAARVCWPRERLLMENVSCAFEPIWDRATRGQIVTQFHKDRLTFVLGGYLAYIGSAWPEARLREAIEQFIAECPRDSTN